MDQTSLQYNLLQRALSYSKDDLMFEAAYLCWKDNWIEDWDLPLLFSRMRRFQTRMTVCIDCFWKGLFQRDFVNRAGKCPNLSILLRMKKLCRFRLAIVMRRFSFSFGRNDWFWGHGSNSLHFQRSNTTITSLKLNPKEPLGVLWIYDGRVMAELHVKSLWIMHN